MLYLSPKTKTLLKFDADSSNWGYLTSPYNRQKQVKEYLFGIDNGAFNKKFVWDKYKKYLINKQDSIHHCLFAVVPDVVTDHESTLKLYKKYNEPIKELGYKLAFVLQDGLKIKEIPGSADWLFVGGTTEFKLSKTITDIIKNKDRPVHVGRVNSNKRILHFYLAGADSVDGTTIIYQPDKRFQELDLFMKNMKKQRYLL